MWPWRVKMPTQNLLMLLLLLIFDYKEHVGNSFVDILTLKFGRDFEPEHLSKYCMWSFAKILKLIFRQNFEAEFFSQGFEAEALSRFWGWSLAEILKLNFDVT